MARHSDPLKLSFAEPRTKPQSLQGGGRQTPRSFLLPSTAVPPQRQPPASTAVPAPSPQELRRADMPEQQRMIRAYRAEQHRQWVAQHDSPSNSNRSKQALHFLVSEAVHYHRRLQSSALNKKLSTSISQKHPGGAPPALLVDPNGCSLSRGVVQQIFDDLDWLVDHYGRDMGARALEQMFLWDTTDRSASAARSLPTGSR